MRVPQFKLIGAIIFIAGTGVAFYFIRAHYHTRALGLGADDAPGGAIAYPEISIEAVFRLTCAFLVSWSVSLLTFELLCPVETLKRRMLSLGFSGCVAASFAAMLVGTLGMVKAFPISPNLEGAISLTVFRLIPSYAGIAVATTWFCQVLGGEFKLGTAWRDMVGVSIGVGWILDFLYESIGG